MNDISEETMQAYKLLFKLTAEDRQRIFNAVAAMCGDANVSMLPGAPARIAQHVPDLAQADLPMKAARWLSSQNLSREALDAFIHIDGANSELIAVTIPGGSKREQMINCYLLCGITQLMKTGEASFQDEDALALCKKYKCHDVANHATYRKQIGNYLAGDKQRGFTLSAPGLKAAADLIREG